MINSSDGTKNNQREGFTLIELVVAMTIILIMGAVVYFSISSVLSDKRARTDAVRLETHLAKARQKAYDTKIPVRVVLNCAKAESKGCVLSTQTAVIRGTGVNGWEMSKGLKHFLNPNVNPLNVKGAKQGFDGDKEVPGVYFAIFMPDHRVYSSPRPFDLFLRYGDKTTGDVTGYRVTLGNNSGKISLVKEKIKL
jgi:prepilin-type N-terminal cleavage/methylation domain-containing protein